MAGMTAKGFVRKASAAKSALGFIAAHRDFLSAGPHALAVAPLLDNLDNGVGMPTPTLREITDLVMACALAASSMPVVTSERRTGRPAGSGRKSEPKAVNVAILVGEDVVDSKGFDNHSSAQRWADLRLVEHPGSVGKVQSALGVFDIDRDSAFARTLGARSSGPVCKRSPTSAPLKSKMKVSSYKAQFSRG